MRKLRNFTLHTQTSREQLLAAELGYDLQLAPEGFSVELGRRGLETAATIQAGRLAEAAAEGSAVLIGGHTGLWIRALDILNEHGITRPELAYFDTRRVHDADDRFVFEPDGLVIIETADSPNPEIQKGSH
jgi:hypothetical protein